MKKITPNKIKLAKDKLKKKTRNLTVGLATAVMVGTGTGLAVQKKQVKDKDALRQRVENILSKQEANTNNTLKTISFEKAGVISEMEDVVIQMINEQQEECSHKISEYQRQAFELLTKKEKEQLIEEMQLCGYPLPEKPNPNNDIMFKHIIAVNENNKNIFSRIVGLDWEDAVIDNTCKYKDLYKKRLKIKQVYYNDITKYNIPNPKYFSGEQSHISVSDFVNPMTISSSSNDSIRFYSPIIKIFIEEGNSRLDGDFWPEDSKTDYKMDKSDYKYYTENTIPNFEIPVFKKYKDKIDSLCNRFFELEKQANRENQQLTTYKNIRNEFSK